jgi:dTDP-4-dehydrorhamnose reductase
VTGTVFITGGAGLLALNWALSQRGHRPVTLALHRRHVAIDGVDVHGCRLDSVDDVQRALDQVQPSLVVHAAAMTNVEACEAAPAAARHVNVDIAANVAAACGRHRIALAHISTDHLFAGEAACVGEDEPVAPRNVYGRTKAEAERRVLDAHPGAIVVRTNFFAWGPSYRPSLSDKVLAWLRGGETATLFTDAYFTPLLADALARAVVDLIAAGRSGVYHVVGDERISKHDFGVKLAQTFGLDQGLIQPALMADAPDLVRRPHDMSLSNARARAALGRPLGGVDVHLQALREQEQRGRARELQML